MDLRARFLSHADPLREPLTAYVRGLLWNSSDLPDALQSTLLTAFRKFSEFAEGTDFRAWIFRIATLTVFGLNRSASHPSAPEPDLEEELEREYAYAELLENPERMLEELDDAVRRAVMELSERERAALLLVAVGGLPYREVATILEMPIGSAMGYVGRARRKLRERLASFARGRTP